MLVVETVLPSGPSSQFLEEGDILISINGQNITKFVPVEECLDENIGELISIMVERGGEEMEFQIMVQDLHSM